MRSAQWKYANGSEHCWQLLELLQRLPLSGDDKRINPVDVGGNGSGAVALPTIQYFSGWTQYNLGGIGGDIKAFGQTVVFLHSLW